MGFFLGFFSSFPVLKRLKLNTCSHALLALAWRWLKIFSEAGSQNNSTELSPAGFLTRCASLFCVWFRFGRRLVGRHPGILPAPLPQTPDVGEKLQHQGQVRTSAAAAGGKQQRRWWWSWCRWWMFFLFFLSPSLPFVPPQGAGWNPAETSSFGARRRVCEFDYVTYCAHARMQIFSVVLCTDARLHTPHKFVAARTRAFHTPRDTHLSPSWILVLIYACLSSIPSILHLPHT